MTRRWGDVDDDVRALAVEQARELIAVGASQTAACRAIGEQLGVHRNTVAAWIRDLSDPADWPTSSERLAAELAATRAQLNAAMTLNRELMRIIGREHDPAATP